jgi:uncharacterized protein YdeI (BOF family)
VQHRVTGTIASDALHRSSRSSQMKRIAFLAAAAALLAAPAFAQQGFDQKTQPGARPTGGSGASMNTGASGAAQPAVAGMKRTAKKSKKSKKSSM